ncbi:hypothetical protein SDC9_141658 [bioreactor metagenome]|uniref:HTH cro/C1-type domain-containing protein n=1 Tax=bioreactor metagenome TaxID=1076179 RepID=A0A645E1Q2_9ZZZZ
MLISNKIRNLIEQSRIQQKELAERIGMTPNGLRNALELDDFRVSTLEKFSEIFKVPITYWFQDQEGNFFLNNEGNLVNGSSFKGNLTVNKGAQEETARIQAENEQLRKELEMMKQLLAAKDETIAALKGK